MPDVIAPDLKVLFCGINPGLYTAAIGHHFGRPGQPLLAGAARRRASRRACSPPLKNTLLLELGYGITNVVDTPRRAPRN